MKTKTAKKTPRRYGKLQIEKDIVYQNGVITELQKTMLLINDLKSLYINLQGKGTSDRYRNTNKFSKRDGQKIRFAIKRFKEEVKSISHPKTKVDFKSS
jgi:hypothetical protein